MHLVSIIIPVHKTVEFLKSCVESALSQTHSNLEVIIACNGSLSVLDCQKFLNINDFRIRYIKTESGRHNARNEALHVANGVFIQFLDYDDILYPNKLEVQLKSVQENLNHHISITKWKKFSKKIDEYYIFPFDMLFVDENISFEQLIKKLGKSGGFIATASWIVSRELLVNIKWIDSPNDDAVFFSEIGKKKPQIRMVSQVLAGCRIHNLNTSAIRSKEQFDLLLVGWRKISYNLKTIENSGSNLYLYRAYLHLIHYSIALKSYRIWTVLYKCILFGLKGGAGFSVYHDLKKKLVN